MNVLMFGWEFAPMYSGGLGVACAGLVKAMIKEGANVTFVLPKLPAGFDQKKLGVISAENYGPKLTLKYVPSLATPYMSHGQYDAIYALYKKRNPNNALYGPNLFAEVARLAEAAKIIAKEIPHDVIHCHDWMTYPAGIAAKAVSHKPLIVHVHATEYDRTGGVGNKDVHAIEQRGFEQADAIVTVSNYTKTKVVSDYQIPLAKITTVHNAIEQKPQQPRIGTNK
ncbi:MAG: glycosyltransferase family 4 protein, partial [Nanoarchaeota archaeon]